MSRYLPRNNRIVSGGRAEKQTLETSGWCDSPSTKAKVQRTVQKSLRFT